MKAIKEKNGKNITAIVITNTIAKRKIWTNRRRYSF